MSRPVVAGKLPIGVESLLAKYEIVDWLGEGGMGVVFLVRHRLLGERRVIKMIHPERAQEPEFRDRFLHEARTAIRYRHPNIAQVFDFNADEGPTYLVMEYIDGITLQDLLRAHGPIDANFAVAIGIQVLQALGFLHRKGVIHRDVSTDNIMLCRSEEGQPLVKLIDLGLAKWMDSDVALTAAQVFLGKIRYAPPEQFSLGTSELDPRGDLYSLGIVLYELVTGCFPILGNDASSIIAGHLFHPPRSFAETDPDFRVPELLRAVLLQALEKDRDHRIPDSRRFEGRLRAALPSWPAHGIEEARLDQMIESVRAAVSARAHPETADDNESAVLGGAPVPTGLGATANIAGGTWLGATSGPPAPGATVLFEVPPASSDSECSGRTCDSTEIPTMDPPIEPALATASPREAPAGPPLLDARWLGLGVALAVLTAIAVLGVWMARSPRRPELPRETPSEVPRVSATLGQDAAATRNGLLSDGGSLPSDGHAVSGGGRKAPTAAPSPGVSVSAVPARRLGGSRPSYPEGARWRFASGVVRLDLEVLPSGLVGRVEVVSESDPDLVAAARQAVADWRFEPATEDGRPVTSSYRVDLQFEPSEEGREAGATGGWEPPVRLYAIQPEYPEAAQEQGIEGEVAAQLTIDARGRVGEVTIKKGLSPELDRAAEAALRQWRFAPGKREGRAVESTYAVTIRFDLEN